MESDAEYKALQTIVTNDRRQRVFIRLLALVAFVVVLAYLQSLGPLVRAQIKSVLDQQTKLVLESQTEGRIRSEENRRYITCLLVVPPTDRDVTAQKYCYDKSDLPGGRSASEFVPIEIDLNDAAVAMLQDESRVADESKSSTQSAPKSTAAKANTSHTATTAEPQQSLFFRVIQPVRDDVFDPLTKMWPL